MFLNTSFHQEGQAPPEMFGKFTLLEKAREFFGLQNYDSLYANVEKQRVTYRVRDRLTKSGYDFVFLDFTKPTPTLTGREVTLRRVRNGHYAD